MQETMMTTLMGFLFFFLLNYVSGFMMPHNGVSRDGFLLRSRKKKSEYLTVQVNEFFKAPVPQSIQDAVAIQKEEKQEFDLVELLTAPPGQPGVPRPLWLVVLASLPTGLLWYGYYKFAVEEELMQLELQNKQTPRGFGGYGTLGPFSYGLLLGPLAYLLHLPGGTQWTTLGILYIYYTQFLLYDRVNELYDNEKPLTVWWCWPIFFPLNLVVGLRQVHFLSQYWYRVRGVKQPPPDPIADFFPFIKVPTLTWQQLFTTPSLWCILLKNQEPIDRTKLPKPIRALLETKSFE